MFMCDQYYYVCPECEKGHFVTGTRTLRYGSKIECPCGAMLKVKDSDVKLQVISLKEVESHE